MDMSKSGKSAYFRHIFLITFFLHIFKTLSTDLKSAWNSAFFDIFSDFCKKKFFLAHFSTFSNFEAKRANQGSKKLKFFFYKHVLDFSYATINGLV